MMRCTCRMPFVSPVNIDPPERIRDRDCPVHGDDPGVEDIQALEPWERDAPEDRMMEIAERRRADQLSGE